MQTNNSSSAYFPYFVPPVPVMQVLPYQFMWNLPHIFQPLAPIPPPLGIYETYTSLDSLYKSYPWTRKHIETLSELQLLQAIAAKFPMVENEVWNQRASQISRDFLGVKFIDYVKHLFSVNFKCFHCGKEIVPVTAASPNGSRQSVGAIDHGTNVQGEEYVRGTPCVACNADMGRYGDTTEKILDTAYSLQKYCIQAALRISCTQGRSTTYWFHWYSHRLQPNFHFRRK